VVSLELIGVGFPGQVVKMQECQFSSRVDSMWNSLPSDVVEADTINTFKNRLGIYWPFSEMTYKVSIETLSLGSLTNQDVFFILMPTRLELEVYQFVCESNVKMWAKRTTCARQKTLDWIGLLPTTYMII